MSGSAKDVELAEVSKSFGTMRAVLPLSLQVRAGEFLTLLGPSGCGKTTLLRLIAGLEQVSSGIIKVGGEDVTDAPPNRRDTSIMFQDYALFPHKSLTDNIAYGLKMRGVPKRDRDAQAATWLETIELSGFGDRLPHQLSGGQRQRVALARSLIVEPGVLLLDEPLGALDANLRRQMQLELRRVHRDVGLTFIYVTHDQEEALTMSDRIAVMRDGRIEQLGTPTEIYDHPETEFVGRFIGQCNVLEAEVIAVSAGSITCESPGFSPLTVAGSKTGSPATGERIAVALRPEAIRLAKGASAPAKNGARVQVEDVTFVGSSLKVSARTSSGQALDIDLNRRDVGARTLEPGQDIAVAWDASAATLMRRSADRQ